MLTALLTVSARSASSGITADSTRLSPGFNMNSSASLGDLDARLINQTYIQSVALMKSFNNKNDISASLISSTFLFYLISFWFLFLKQEQFMLRKQSTYLNG